MSKLTIGVIAVCILLLISDFTGRFIQTSPHAQNNFDTSNNNTQPLPLLSSNAHKELTTLFSRYAKPAKSVQTEQGLTAAQQAEQQGELLSLFAGDLELKLKAVIFAPTPYALIEQKNIKTQQTTLVKYLNEQSIQGYTLTIMTNTQVALNKAPQHITLVMYQRG
ncbi:hypothetical protein I6F53_00225 [Pseudoalteromonas sp. SWN29]|uniref:hypothetical protein n=1 Tax=Pseudoalteromonas sp. SWN29 TaxID=2792064 RepID=UPI0018CCF6F4|nr:hypothetical protein [Pseudoalteromonas sp. SWN29]MBH0025407.1 hypothetical protein [Pseudoalteromonas sp. SWN29]